MKKASGGPSRRQFTERKSKGEDSEKRSILFFLPGPRNKFDFNILGEPDFDFTLDNRPVFPQRDRGAFPFVAATVSSKTIDLPIGMAEKGSRAKLLDRS